MVSVKGNEPHIYLSLVTLDGKEYRITGPHYETIFSKYQQRKLSLSGTITEPAKGPWLPALFQVDQIVQIDPP